MILCFCVPVFYWPGSGDLLQEIRSSSKYLKWKDAWPVRPIYTDKKITKFSSYIRKSRRERLKSHIWLTASWYMTEYLRISSYIRKPFLIYDFATAPIWISLYMRKIFSPFLSMYIALLRPQTATFYNLRPCWLTSLLRFSMPSSVTIFACCWGAKDCSPLETDRLVTVLAAMACHG